MRKFILFGLFVLVSLVGFSEAASTSLVPEEEWDKTFGGSDSDWAYSIQQTTDGGYIVAGGYTESYGAGYSDAWLIKTDSSGNEQWSKTFGGPDWDSAHSVYQTIDGGYIVAGLKDAPYPYAGDLWLIKTDANGNEEWNKTFGGIKWDEAFQIQQTSDGGYIVAGRTCYWSS